MHSFARTRIPPLLLAVCVPLACARSPGPAEHTITGETTTSEPPTEMVPAEPDAPTAPETTTSDTTATETTAPEPPAATEPADAPPVDMTPAAAPTLCGDLVDEPTRLTASTFARGGLVLPTGSRADVLTCRFDDAVNGEVVQAYLVVRTPDAAYYASTMVGEAYDVPGNSLSYRLGRLVRRQNDVRLQVTQTDTEYPCTGDPSETCPPEVARERVDFVCTYSSEYEEYECGRE